MSGRHTFSRIPNEDANFLKMYRIVEFVQFRRNLKSPLQEALSDLRDQLPPQHTQKDYFLASFALKLNQFKETISDEGTMSDDEFTAKTEALRTLLESTLRTAGDRYKHDPQEVEMAVADMNVGIDKCVNRDFDIDELKKFSEKMLLRRGVKDGWKN